MTPVEAMGKMRNAIISFPPTPQPNGQPRPRRLNASRLAAKPPG